LPHPSEKWRYPPNCKCLKGTWWNMVIFLGIYGLPLGPFSEKRVLTIQQFLFHRHFFKLNTIHDFIHEPRIV
jgi:hypothetical protein